MGAIKNIRQFKQFPENEKGRKDSLSGELNALIFNGKYKKPSFTENAIAFIDNYNLLSQGEGLSAVSFVKRFYKYDENESFSSTAEIACLNTIEKVKKSADYKNYKAMFNDQFDAQLLYEENLYPIYFYKQGLIELLGTNEKAIEKEIKLNKTLIEIVNKLINSKLEDFKKKYKTLNTFIKAEKLTFNKYYAVLVFDVDSMGEWLSGDCLKDDKNNDAKLKKYHLKLSELLAEFAEKAKNYVDHNKIGRTIYAGGDDFLALINLDGIFETLIHLRNLFDTEVNIKLKAEFNRIDKGLSLTFSAGLTIAHYKEPLGEVLNRARGLEQKAKQISDKNAIAISVMKHSGEMQEMVIKWGDSINITRNIENVSAILESLTKKDFSPAFIDYMNRIFEIFKEKQHNEIGKLDEIFETECSRLIKRACLLKREETEKSEDFKIRKNNEIEKLLRYLVGLHLNTNITKSLEILNIIDFIYRKA